tara:strand:+ start:1674 stop:1940 length:267 start_codon:yes stop_codon:yes gene_type:complete
VFFLIPSSLKLAFQEEAEAKESIITPKFVFFCVLKIQNENILREEEEKHHAALLLLSCIVVVEKGESHRRERERKWTKRSSILNGLLR